MVPGRDTSGVGQTGSTFGPRSSSCEVDEALPTIQDSFPRGVEVLVIPDPSVTHDRRIVTMNNIRPRDHNTIYRTRTVNQCRQVPLYTLS